MEQLQQFLDTIIFIIGDAQNPESYRFTVLNLLYVSILLITASFVFTKYQKLITQIVSRFEIVEKEQNKIRRFFRIVLFSIVFLLFFKSLGLYSYIETFTDYSIHNYNCSMVDNPDYVPEIRNVTGDITTPAQGSKEVQKCDNHFRISNIINAILAFFFIRIILWIILQLMIGYYKRKEMDSGSQYAINQLIKYVIYVALLLTVIQALGFNLTVIWGGAAALLVGFGLGLQQTFNDLFSGIIIMIEGSVHVGDMVRVKGDIGKVTKIGIRASEVRLRDDAELIVPNSHLVMDSIANWNHNDQKARFFIKVGVAYGSDTELIKKILLDIVVKHEKVIDSPKPFVRFVDFGNSSLDFELHFWTFDVFGVLNTQSDLRFEIDKAFREHKIEIPFPQRDLWVRNATEFK
jgi:small-conductance mechanosensitive channel